MAVRCEGFGASIAVNCLTELCSIPLNDKSVWCGKNLELFSDSFQAVVDCLQFYSMGLEGTTSALLGSLESFTPPSGRLYAWTHSICTSLAASLAH